MNRQSLLAACLTSVLLAACGQSSPKQTASAAPVGVFTSGQDCAASGKLILSDCNILLRMAMDAHQQTAKPYISMRLCEAAEGVDHCERTDSNAFRRKLLAFQVIFTSPPTSAPLYAPKDKTVLGFSTQDNSKTLLAVDETLTFSADAKFVAESQVATN